MSSEIEKRSKQARIRRTTRKHITSKSFQWAVITSSTSISTMKKIWKKLLFCSKNWSMKILNQTELQTSTSRFTWLINFDFLANFSSRSRNSQLRSKKKYYIQINVRQWLWKSKITNVNWRIFYTFLIWKLICCSKNTLWKKICKRVLMTTICTCTLHKTHKCSE